MTDPATVNQINLKEVIDGMLPLWDEFEKEVETSNDNAKEKKMQRTFNKRLRRAVDMLSNKVVGLLTGLYGIVEDRHTEKEDANKKLNDKCVKLEADNINTKIEQDKEQQRHKWETIRIHNIEVPSVPSGHRENVSTTVVNYLKDANIDISEDRIKSAFRPMKDGRKGTNVYCTFLRGSDKLNILRKRKVNMTDNNEFKRKRPGSFITEDLTPLRQLISYKLRQDKDRISRSWSMDGKIKCMKTGHGEEDKPITIDSPYDLKHVGWTPEEINVFIQQNILKNSD